MTRSEGHHNRQIEDLFAGFGERTAMITPDGQRVSFAGLNRTVRAFAARLRAEGVGPGTVVAPFHENPAVFQALLYALVRVGASAAAVPSPDMAARIGLKIDLAISLPDRPSVAVKNLTFDQEWFAASGDDGIGPDGFLIHTSSGTTGAPKFYRVPLASIVSGFEWHERVYPCRDTDLLITIPVFAGYGTFLGIQAQLGGGAILRPAASARQTLEQLAPQQALEIRATPAVLADLIVAVRKGAPVPERLRAIMLGGSPLSKRLARQGEEVLDCKVFNNYGAAETAATAITRPATAAEEQGFVGTPFPWAEFRIENDDGSEAVAGSEGGVAVRVPADYWTVEALVGESPIDENGWFRAGDRGYLRTDDGALVITGRENELINSSGSKVAPIRYEEAALRLVPATAAAAFGIPNDLGSEDVGLALVADEQLDLKQLQTDLTALVGTHLNFFAFQVDRIPVNQTGKVDRKALLQQLAPTRD